MDWTEFIKANSKVQLIELRDQFRDDILWKEEENDNRTNFSSSLTQLCEELVAYLTSNETTDSKEWLELASEVLLCFEDVKVLMLQKLNELLAHSNCTTSENFCETSAELLQLLLPSLKKGRKFLGTYYRTNRQLSNQLKCKRINRFYCQLWIEFLKLKLPEQVLTKILVWIPEQLMDRMPEPILLTDFYVRSFQIGDPFNMLALNGIFLLIHQHNLDYPEFYSQVYSLLQPSLCYSEHRDKFFKLLDIFLSSTHLPAYLSAAFAKRIARLALLAPLECSDSLIVFVRNLLVRYPLLAVLVQRDTENILTSDPYDMMESDPAKSNAMESSLWEIKSLQSHWYGQASKQSSFIDKPLPQMESFLRPRKLNAIIDEELEKEMKEEKEVAVTFVAPKSLFQSNIFEIF